MSSTTQSTTAAPPPSPIETSASTAAPSLVPSPTRVVEPTSADTAAFLAEFRSLYPQLADGRRDNPIANLLDNTCQEIGTGKETSIIVVNAGKRAAYQNATPTPDQAQAIYDLASKYCPN